MIKFFERLYYNPKWYHYLVALLLLPFSFLYGLVGLIKTLVIKPKEFNIKIVSIGNLTVGGSGKTPFAIEIIKHFYKKYKIDIFYISRGYGRESKGLVWVKRENRILTDVKRSGDEAMLVARECRCNVIVSEDRAKAINLAKKSGADLIILDDAFSKVGIKKFDILLEPKRVLNKLVLPAGPFREFAFAKNRANLILKEDRDFKRVVEFKNLSHKMLLVTAIANANRLKPYLPKGVVDKFILKDHAFFKKEEIIEKMRKSRAKTLLVTQKDMVKLEHFNLPISVMKLKLNIKNSVIKAIEEYYEK